MAWLDPIDPYWIAAALVFLMWVAWRVLRSRVHPAIVGGDDEVHIVLSVAALRQARSPLGAAAVARAALCNAEVAAAFERRGMVLDLVATRLDELLGDSPSAEASSKEIALQDDLQTAVNAASLAAVARGDAEFSLADLMAAIAEGEGSVADFLRQLGVAFEDTWVATTSGKGEDEAFVYVWNDDASPMEKVVDVLRDVFGEDELRSSYLMMSVHLRGFVALGPYGERRADTLVEEANACAQELEIPLQVRREPPDTQHWKQTTHHGLLP